MEPVFVSQETVPDNHTHSVLLNWVLERLAGTGYRVERENFGEIRIGKKQIRKGLGYLSTDGEIAAFAAVPDVIQKGTQIGEHDNHKGRGYDTVTFAAPVEINGTRGNMAVTVIKTDANNYRTHRILMPDGSEFTFASKKDALKESYPDVTMNHGSPSSSTDNASSKNSIPAVLEKVKSGTEIFEALGREEPGLRKLYGGKLTEEQSTQLRILDALGRQYGLEFDIVEKLGDANAMYAGGRRIAVGLDALDQAYVQAGAHEMVHYVRAMDEGSYGMLQEVVLEHLRESELIDLEEEISNRIRQYEEGGYTLDREGAIEEIVAETVPAVFTNEESVRMLVNRDRTLAEKIRDFFVNFAKKLREIAFDYAVDSGHMEIPAVAENAKALMDIAYTFDDALEAVRGKETERIEQEYGARFSRKSFSDQLDELRSGVFPRNDHLYVMETPEVLKNIGFRELPVLLTQRHAKSVMKVSGSDSKANYHGLTVTMMKQLPEAIANPAMILKAHGYDNRVIVITELKDSQGNTVIAPIEMDGKGMWEERKIDANILTTAYGKEKIKEMLLQAVMNDEVMFTDKKRSDTLAHAVGVQFPKRVANGGFIHSISDFQKEVNGSEKFSLKNTDDNADVNEETAETVSPEEAREKLNSVYGRKETEADLRKLAGELARETQSGMKRAEIVEGLYEVADAYAENGDAENAAAKLARKIISESQTRDTGMQESYAETLKRLRENGIRLTETQKQEIASQYGSVSEWRKRMFGRVKVSNNGISLDSLWQELSGRHPEMFNVDTGEGEMPEALSGFIEKTTPQYVNQYGMDKEAAAAELGLRIQGEVLNSLGKADSAQQALHDAQAMRERYAAQSEERSRQAAQARVQRFREMADKLTMARGSGDAETIQRVLEEYRQTQTESGSLAQGAAAAQMNEQVKTLRKETARLTRMIHRLEEMISSDDMDLNREKLIGERDSYTELRDQLKRQTAALHRQAAITQAGMDVETEDGAWQAEAALSQHLNDYMREYLQEEMREEVRGRRDRLKEEMNRKYRGYNRLSTLTAQEVAGVFEDLTGETVSQSRLAQVWSARREAATAQIFEERNTLNSLKKRLRSAKAHGEAGTDAISRQILESQERLEVLTSQEKTAKTQEQFCRRMGASDMGKALREGRLPQPVMERIIGMCAEAGRTGRLNQTAAAEALEAIRLNSTMPTRVWDDLFGEYSPIMRGIYFDPVMDNESGRQQWIADWRARIAALKLTGEESELVQKIGEGRASEAELNAASEKVTGAVEVFRTFYEEAYDKTTAALTRNGYEKPGYIKRYFPHIDKPQTLLQKMGFSFEDSTLPTSINGLTESFTPGRQYSGFLQHREGKTTDYDALFGFEAYINSVSNVIYHTDDIQRLRQLETEIRSAAKNGIFDGLNGKKTQGGESTHLSEFVKWVHEYTNLLAGKKSSMDRGAESMGGRAVYDGLNKLKGMKGAAAVMGNVGSAVTNMVPVTQIMGEHPIATLKGASQMLRECMSGKQNVPESKFKIRRFGSDSVIKTAYGQFSKGAGKPFEWVDLFATNLVVNSYYQNNLDMGMDSETAMRNADAQAARLMGDRSKGTMPNLYGDQILGFVTQFQLEVANQFQHFRKDICTCVRKTGQEMFFSLLKSELHESAGPQIRK